MRRRPQTKKPFPKKSVYSRRLLTSSIPPPEFDQWNWTDKRVKFCWAYCKYNSKTKAAEEAGYSKKTAAQNGTRFFTQKPILKYISMIHRRYEASVERVINEICYIAFSDPRDFIDDKNNVKDIKTLTREQAASIDTITVNKNTTKITRYNKIESLKMLGRHLGVDLDKKKETIINKEQPKSGNQWEEAVSNATTEELERLRDAQLAITGGMDDSKQSVGRKRFEVVR